MTLHDVLRLVSLASAGTSYVLAIFLLVISYAVLHPTRLSRRSLFGGGHGVLWLHLVSIVIGTQGFVTWGTIEVYLRLEGSPTLRPLALLVLTTIMNIGYVVILRIESARYRMRVHVPD